MSFAGTGAMAHAAVAASRKAITIAIAQLFLIRYSASRI